MNPCLTVAVAENAIRKQEARRAAAWGALLRRVGHEGLRARLAPAHRRADACRLAAQGIEGNFAIDLFNGCVTAATRVWRTHSAR